MSFSPNSSFQTQENIRHIDIKVTDLRNSTWSPDQPTPPHINILKLVINSDSGSESYSNLDKKIRKSKQFKKDIHFEIANPDCLRISAANVTKLGNNDNLVLLDAGQNGFPCNYSFDISTTPHTRSLTNQEGKFYGTEEHNAAGCALAEFVDNALAATVGNAGAGEERRIEIHFYDSDTAPSLHILDNGCGMNSTTLRSSLIYKAPKEGRRNQSSAAAADVPPQSQHQQEDEDESVHPLFINSDISKFGAGMKHAVFWLGDEMRIMTKTAAMEGVVHVHISRRVMEERELIDNVNAWVVPVGMRKIGVVPDEDADDLDPNIRRLITQREPGKKNFTHLVVLNIRQTILDLLRRKDEVGDGEKNPSIEKELSHIYHYYLRGRDGSRIDRLKNCNISIHRYDPRGKETRVTNLRYLEDNPAMQSLEYKFVHSSTPEPYLFTVEVANYFPDKKRNSVPLRVGGIIRYHPFLYDRETKPGGVTSMKQRGGDGDVSMMMDIDDASNSSSTRGDTPSPNTVQDGDDSREFHIFWNGRLIPYTKLKCFDWCSPGSRCKTTDKLYKSFGRISGSLFFDSSVTEIADNKLNLSTTTDLYNMFNSDKKIGSKVSTFFRVETAGGGGSRKSVGQSGGKLKSKRMNAGPRENFKEWLKKCQEYDKQVIYKGLLAVAKTKALPPTPNQILYSSATWENKTFKVGDAVRLRSTTTTGSAKGANICGIIRSFNVPALHCGGASTSTSSSQPNSDQVTASLFNFYVELQPASYYPEDGVGSLRLKEMRLIDTSLAGGDAKKLIAQQLQDLDGMQLQIDWNVDGAGSEDRLEPGAHVQLDEMLIKRVAFDVCNEAGVSLNGSLAHAHFESKSQRKSIHMIARVYQLHDDGSRQIYGTSSICDYYTQPGVKRMFYFLNLDLQQMLVKNVGNYVITFRTYIDLISKKGGGSSSSTTSVAPGGRSTRSNSPRSSTPTRGRPRTNNNTNTIEDYSIDPDADFSVEWDKEVDTIGRKILREAGDVQIRMPFLEIPFTVVAGSPETLSIKEFGEEGTLLRIGQPFRVTLALLDLRGNITEAGNVKDFTALTITALKPSSKSKSADLSLTFTHKKLVIEEGQLVIQDVTATGYLLGHEWQECKVEVRLQVGNKTFKASSQAGNIRFYFGLPSLLEVANPTPFENGGRPGILCRVLDSARNIIPYQEPSDGNEDKKPILLQCDVYKGQELVATRNVMASKDDTQHCMDEGLDLPELKRGQVSGSSLLCKISYPAFPHLSSISVPLLAVPSTRPETIRIYLQTGKRNQETEILNESHLVRKINEKLEFSLKLFDGQGQLVEFDKNKHRLKMNWAVDGEEDTSGKLIPDFIIPEKVKKDKELSTSLRITGYEGAQVRHKFYLTSLPLSPNSLKAFFFSGDEYVDLLLPRGTETKVPIGQNLPSLGINVLDAFDNLVTDFTRQDASSLLEIVGVDCEIDYDEPLPANETPQPPSQSPNRAYSFLVQNLRFANPPLGVHSINVSYKSQFQDTVAIKIIPGLPDRVALQIGGVLQKQRGGVYTLSNDSTISICGVLLDSYQNKTLSTEDTKFTFFFGPEEEWESQNGQVLLLKKGEKYADLGKVEIPRPRQYLETCPMKLDPCRGRCFGKSKFLRVETTLNKKSVVSTCHFHLTARPEIPFNLDIKLLKSGLFSYEAGSSTFHNLTVTLEGEDGEKFVAAEKDHLTLKLIRDEDNIEEYVEAEAVWQGVYTFAKVPTKAGTYSAEFIYNNNNQANNGGLNGGVSFSQAFDEKLEIYPGPPDALCPFPQELGEISVSNDPNNADSRIVAENLVLLLKDGFGNVCTLNPNQSQTEGNNLDGEVTLKFLNEEDQATNLLQDGSILSTAFPLENGSLTFPSPLVVKPNLDLGKVSKHVLRFTATLPGYRTRTPIFYDLEFTFFNDVLVQQEISSLEATNEVLKAQITAAKGTLNTIETHRAQLLATLETTKAIEAQQRGFYSRYNNDQAALNALKSVGDVAARERVLSTDKLRLTSSTGSRLSESTLNHGPCSSEPGVLGPVGLLARIKHSPLAPQIQRVLSWHLQSNLTVIAVEEEKRGLELKVKYPRERFMILDITKGGYISWNERDCALSGPGHPIYARFLLDLEGPPDKTQSIRKVFDKLLGNLIIIDTLPEATRFMKEYNHTRRDNCPTILTRDGDRLSSIGIIGGDSNTAPGDLRQIKYRLGIGMDPEVGRIGAELEALFGLRGAILGREAASRKLQDFEGMERGKVDDLRRSLKDAEEQRNQIGRKLGELRTANSPNGVATNGHHHGRMNGSGAVGVGVSPRGRKAAAAAATSPDNNTGPSTKRSRMQ